MAAARPARLAARTRMAAAAGTWVGHASRRLGLGSGSVIGGRVLLGLDPRGLSQLAWGHRLGLVSGTNGKTTTTRLLAGALGSAGPSFTNRGGSNLPAGLVAALAGAPAGACGALEVDEAWLGHVAEEVRPSVITLLNLSRDQLDRVSEVRRLAASWRAALARAPETQVVANADDPIVAWAAAGARAGRVGGSAGLGGGASRVTWVAAGQPWREDASGCPECEARIVFSGPSWGCPSCSLARPQPDAWLEGAFLVLAGDRRLAISLALPGRFNLANAAMAAVAASKMGVDMAGALAAMAGVHDVSGRYQLVDVGGPGRAGVRLLLAKNPAGWVELFDLLAPPPAPVVLAVNARLADGRDPSWLWDVPFERLSGRQAVVTGDRRADLAVRLVYAEVDHVVVADPREALREAVGRVQAADHGSPVDFVGNYTAFQDVRAALGLARTP